MIPVVGELVADLCGKDRTLSYASAGQGEVWPKDPFEMSPRYLVEVECSLDLAKRLKNAGIYIFSFKSRFYRPMFSNATFHYLPSFHDSLAAN